MHKQKKDRPKPHYSLDDVKRLITEDRVEFWSSALNGAEDDFGWGSSMILKALKQLREKDFYKQDVSLQNRRLELDFYKATIMGERIYTHFYIDDDVDTLVIQSFKRQ